MNTLDVEIMWTLRQSPHHHVSSTEITKINSHLIFDETTKERLSYLSERKFIDIQDINGTEIGYRLTADGTNFLWGGELKQRILNVLSTGDYSITHLSSILNENRDILKREINLMQDETLPLVTRYDKERTRYIKLTASGENYLQPNDNSDSNTNIKNDAEQANVSSSITIQSITNEIDKLLTEINNESNLTHVEKEFLTKSIRDTSGKFAELKEVFEVFGEKFTRDTLKSFLGTSSVD